MSHEAKTLRGRIEDRRFLVGEAKYVDDSKPQNLAFLGIVRSGYAHAKIIRIDFTKAAAHPDFITSITGEDLRKLGIKPSFEIPSDRFVKRSQLAIGKVTYVGEPVAAILSRKKYSVEDIIELVEVEYDPLPAVTTIEESKEKRALIYEDWDSNVLIEKHFKKGDAERAIASSSSVAKARLGIRRQAGTPIEPRAVIASYDAQNDVYNVNATVQGAHRVRNYLSFELGIPPEKVHAIVNDVGGAFGTKGAQSYAAVPLSCILAKKTGLTVKWVSTRTEDLIESAQGRDQYCDIELGCDSSGRITALIGEISADSGVGGTLKAQPLLSSWLLPGAYKIPNIEIFARAYLTNKTPGGPVRGAGRPEAAFYIESIVDKIARQLKIDPIEFRRRNVIPPSEFPYDNGVGFVYDSANLPGLLDALVKASKYEELLRWRDDFNSKNETMRAGIGVCLEIEDTGAQLTESARVLVSKDGSVTVFTGSSPHGQGHETTLALTVSRELGAPLEKIKVLWGDTASIQSGIGTFGSRSAATGGSAALEAARKVKAQIIEQARKLLGKEGLDLKEGYLVLDNSSGIQTIMEFSDLMQKLGDVEARSEFKLNALTFASGAHLCALLINCETGKASIKKYIAVDDAGTVIDETIVEGQIHGGVVHGIGGALLEELLYDEEGQPLASNFLNYTIPTSLDEPLIETVHFETPSKVSLNGARGVGESGTTGAYPAIFNAINDALASIPGAREIHIAPATPEKIYLAAHGKEV